MIWRQFSGTSIEAIKDVNQCEFTVPKVLSYGHFKNYHSRSEIVTFFSGKFYDIKKVINPK
jgi:hypothetical protein